jgi:hypothetical protein
MVVVGRATPPRQQIWKTASETLYPAAAKSRRN